MPFPLSIFPRITAALLVLLLIGSLSLACIGGTALLVPMLRHGDSMEHADGKIVSIGPGMNFVLETSTGQRVYFQCGEACRASLGHMQRHMREHANTDVYYMEGPNKSLLALDVD